MLPAQKKFNTDATMEDVDKFFSAHGNVKSVRMRKFFNSDKQKVSALFLFASTLCIYDTTGLLLC